MENVKKNKKVKVTTKSGGEYSYAYTDLASINTYLENKGIEYYQFIERIEQEDYMMTVIIEKGIEKSPRRGCKVINANTTSGGNAVQDYGAVLTYIRRYSLLMALGLATDDNDANELTPGNYKVDDKKSISIQTKEQAENYVIHFGKYQGQTLKEIQIIDERYIEWLLDNAKDETTKNAIKLLLKDDSEDKLMKTDEMYRDMKLFPITEAIKNKIIEEEKLLTHFKIKSIEELNLEQQMEAIQIISKKKEKINKEKEEIF